MRFSRLLVVASCACSGGAFALSIDGDTQLHAAVGQRLQVAVPVSFASDEVSRLYYRLTPAAGLADAEERAAAAVHASFSPAGPAIVLTTSTRVTVPAMRLHLEVGAGSMVVSRDLTVLFDIPDLTSSAPLDAPATATKPAADSVPAQSDSAVPAGARAIAIQKEEDQKTPLSYGDGALRSGEAASATAAQAAPRVAHAPVARLAPRPHYFNTYQVKPGDTLGSIAEHLSRAGAGGTDAVMLAVFEANIENFPLGDPMHPLVGHKLGIPTAAAIAGEPAYRVAEFKDYLRDPMGEWQVPVNLLPWRDAPAEPVERKPSFWRRPHTLIGAGVLSLLLWGLRKFFAGGAHTRTHVARRALTTAGVPAVHPNAFTPPPSDSSRDRKLLLVPEPQDSESEQVEISRLRSLLNQQPTRADLRLRLAQRLYEARRSAGFAEVALPLEESLSPEAWERVRVMGHELLPSDFRFQPQAGITPAPELLSMLQQSQAAKKAPPSVPGSGAVEFDLQAEMELVEKSRSKVFRGGGQPA
ncbi:MAG: hypothetical protein P4L83_23160 [Nevskia sp.]|nr:hypothetical protein [Nevskia sp.]